MLRTARWVTGSALRDLVLFALVWGWMVQLLIPFGEATKIPAIHPFMLFLGGLFAIDFLIGNRFGRIALKCVLLCTFIYYNFYTQYLIYDPKWLLHWGTDLYFSISLALRQHFELMPDSVYTTVFVIVLCLFQSLFRQSLKLRTWMLTLLILGSIVLGVLDTFYVDNDKMEIVLYILIGLLLLAGMQLPMIERAARMPQKMRGWPIEWLAWTVVLSLIVVGTSSAAPKQMNATWPDPVAYLNSKVATGPVHQKIGYSSDDTHLGGPFDMDDTPVFTVITNTESYYRGETKIIYTGKGWLSASMGQPVQNPADITPMEQHESTTMQTKKVVQTFSFQKDMYPVVFNEYRMIGVSGIKNDLNNVTYSDYDSRLMIGELKAGTSYTVTSQVPIYDEQQLKNASVPGTDQGFTPYLILPSEVPQRVKALAQQITKDAKTPYERAQALESYLRNNYSYDTTNVPVPANNQDFVDQFLFDTKRGYCDHFSSAFVVMAREIGLPSRWVKGFTTGDADLSYTAKNPDEHKYVVENKNAHAWAEVYFAGIGWVPFEPTASFPAMPRLTTATADTQTLAPVVPVPDTHKKNLDQPDTPDKTTSTFTINWQAIGIDAIYLFVLLLILAFLFRRKLMTWYYLRRVSQGDDAMTAMNRLLPVLAKFGWRRTDDMTLREYATELSASADLRGREMIPLAKLFERVRYGQQNVSDKEKSQVRDLWSRMIRKAGRFKRK